jgi:hypothetical protein
MGWLKRWRRRRLEKRALRALGELKLMAADVGMARQFLMVERLIRTEGK